MKNHNYNPFISGKNSRCPEVKYVQKTRSVKIDDHEPILLPGYRIDKDLIRVGITREFVNLIHNSKLNAPQLKFLIEVLARIQRDRGKVYLRAKDLAKNLNKSDSIVWEYIKVYESLGLLQRVQGEPVNSYYVNPFYAFVGDRITFVEDIDPTLVSCAAVI